VQRIGKMGLEVAAGALKKLRPAASHERLDDRGRGLVLGG